ncbi:MAG: hypothetical protein IKI76_11105 [Selenomonadaceae bacterium]|nr:hypothetical protein [Selenomonadaceae bacterium]
MFWQLDKDGYAYRETETVKERIYITERYDVCLVSCIVGKDGRTIEKFNTQTLESGIAGKTNAEFAIVEKYIGSGNEQLIEQLDYANKKIAVLEKKVKELTIKNIYSELQTA